MKVGTSARQSTRDVLPADTLAGADGLLSFTPSQRQTPAEMGRSGIPFVAHTSSWRVV